MDNFVWARSAMTALASVALMLGASGCNSAGGATYDIAPVFPLSANKCEKYNGKKDGRHCWVNLDDCKRAAADWAESTKNVSGAIKFKCE